MLTQISIFTENSSGRNCEISKISSDLKIRVELNDLHLISKKISPRDIEIPGWSPARSVLPHREKVLL